MSAIVLPPREPIVDLRTGLATREFYRFLSTLFTIQGEGAITDDIAFQIDPLAMSEGQMLAQIAALAGDTSPPKTYEVVPDDQAPTQNGLLASLKKLEDAVGTLPAISGVQTFTPNIAFGGGTTGITYNASYHSGSYVTVGKVLFYSIQLVLTSKGSSTGAATVTGLPVTSAAYNQSAGPEYYIDFAAGVVPIAVIQASSTAISLVDYATGGNITDAGFMNSTQIFHNGFYLVP